LADDCIFSSTIIPSRRHLRSAYIMTLLVLLRSADKNRRQLLRAKAFEVSSTTTWNVGSVCQYHQRSASALHGPIVFDSVQNEKRFTPASLESFSSAHPKTVYFVLMSLGLQMFSVIVTMTMYLVNKVSYYYTNSNQTGNSPTCPVEL